jgi:hypothetical protein
MCSVHTYIHSVDSFDHKKVPKKVGEYICIALSKTVKMSCIKREEARTKGERERDISSHLYNQRLPDPQLKTLQCKIIFSFSSRRRLIRGTSIQQPAYTIISSIPFYSLHLLVMLTLTS